MFDPTLSRRFIYSVSVARLETRSYPKNFKISVDRWTDELPFD